MCLVFGGWMFRFWCSRCIVVFRGWLVVVYTGVSIHGAAAAVLCSKMNLISELCPYWYSQSYQGGWGSQRRTSTPCGWLMVMIMLLAHNTTNFSTYQTLTPPPSRYASVAGCRLHQQRLPAAISPNKIRVFKKRRITNYWMARCYHLFAAFCVYLHWFYSNINNCQLFSTSSCQTSACFVIMRKSVE